MSTLTTAPVAPLLQRLFAENDAISAAPIPAFAGLSAEERARIMSSKSGYLDFYGRLYGVEPKVRAKRIADLLEMFELDQRARDRMVTFSRGMQQKVALARALLHEPAVLFLDEPTAGLDPVAARGVHELIDGLRRRGVTIFLTTHRLEEAERLCDRVAILNTRLRTIGRPAELRDRLFARSLAVQTLAPLPEPGRVFSGLPAVDGWRHDGAASYALAVSDPAAAAPAVTRALVAAGADVLSVGESHHSLEDVYLELIDTDEEASRR